MAERLERRTLSGSTLALAVWLAYFSLVYAFLSIGCSASLGEARLFGANAVSAALAAISLATLLFTSYLGWRAWIAWRREDGNARSIAGFLSLLALLVAILAAISTVWVAVPILVLSPCA